MTRQTITIGPEGGISGLQVKPGKGVDLRQFGPAKIERASEVLWDETEQKWYVECRKGVHAGETLQQFEHDVITRPVWNPASLLMEALAGKTAYFDDYDEAVQAEIAWLDFIRKTEGAAALQ